MEKVLQNIYEVISMIDAGRLASTSNPLMETLQDLSGRLAEAGVKWSLVGGIALSYHSVPRGTQDLDIVINESDLSRATSIDGFKKIAPHMLEHRKTGVTTDVLTPSFVKGSGKNFKEAISGAELHDGIPVAKPEAIVVLKLNRSSRQDMADIEKLFKYHPDMDFSNFELTDEQKDTIQQFRDELNPKGE